MIVLYFYCPCSWLIWQILFSPIMLRYCFTLNDSLCYNVIVIQSDKLIASQIKNKKTQASC